MPLFSWSIINKALSSALFFMYGVQLHEVSGQVIALFLKVAPAGKELLAMQPVQQNLAWGMHFQQPKDFGNLGCLLRRGGTDKL